MTSPKSAQPQDAPDVGPATRRPTHRSTSQKRRSVRRRGSNNGRGTSLISLVAVEIHLVLDSFAPVWRRPLALPTKPPSRSERWYHQSGEGKRSVRPELNAFCVHGTSTGSATDEEGGFSPNATTPALATRNCRAVIGPPRCGHERAARRAVWQSRFPLPIFLQHDRQCLEVFETRHDSMHHVSGRTFRGVSLH